MYPIGSFERLKYDILEVYHDYGEGEYVTFGILIADPRQTAAKEYIYNYIDIFDEESGKYMNFFIPGFSEEPFYGDGKKVFRIKNKNYYFSYVAFKNFIKNLNSLFDIEYTYNPMLILMSIIPGHLDTAKYIIIELDDNEVHDVRRSGLLFRQIFKSAKKSLEIKDFESTFQKTYIKGNWLDSLINSMGNSWLCEMKEINKGMKRYKIRSK